MPTSGRRRRRPCWAGALPSTALRHLLGEPDYTPARLIEHRLVLPRREGYLFGHALIRDAAYETLLKARQRELHARAADWFDGRGLDEALRCAAALDACTADEPLAFATLHIGLIRALVVQLRGKDGARDLAGLRGDAEALDLRLAAQRIETALQAQAA